MSATKVAGGEPVIVVYARLILCALAILLGPTRMRDGTSLPPVFDGMADFRQGGWMVANGSSEIVPYQPRLTDGAAFMCVCPQESVLAEVAEAVATRGTVAHALMSSLPGSGLCVAFAPPPDRRSGPPRDWWRGPVAASRHPVWDKALLAARELAIQYVKARDDEHIIKS